MPDYPGPSQTVAKPGFDSCNSDVRGLLTAFSERLRVPQGLMISGNLVDPVEVSGRARKALRRGWGRETERRWREAGALFPPGSAK